MLLKKAYMLYNSAFNFKFFDALSQQRCFLFDTLPVTGLN